MAEQFVSVPIEDILVGEELPSAVYLFIDFRFIALRGAGDIIDRAIYNRLEIRKMRNVFINDKDRQTWNAWVQKGKAMLKAAPPVSGQRKVAQAVQKVREDMNRKTMDIFEAEHPDKAIQQTMGASKKLVTEMLKAPYAVKSLAELQTYSQGTVDHSVNVSILSAYLALQMGYSHAVILQHVSMGGLLHDVGKTRVKIDDADLDKDDENGMRQHPILGAKLLDSVGKVPNEVKLIVAHHHECHDGTGYPKKLRGASIYDLAKIVSIANAFDELVGDGQGSLQERQKSAVQQLDKILYKKFDPLKLEKALRILKLGV